jgi:hypothetical protein
LVAVGREKQEGAARLVLLVALRRGTVQRVEERGEERGESPNRRQKGDRLNAE